MTPELFGTAGRSRVELLRACDGSLLVRLHRPEETVELALSEREAEGLGEFLLDVTRGLPGPEDLGMPPVEEFALGEEIPR